MVEVISYIPIITVLDSSVDFAIVVPNAWTTAVNVGSPFNLVSSGCNSPGEILRHIF